MRTEEVRGPAALAVLAVLAATLLAVGCGGGEEAPAGEPTGREAPTPGDATGEAPAADPDTAAVPLVERIYDYGLRFGESVAAITERLGPPAAADTSLQPNRHVPEATDSLFTLEYGGLTFELNRPGPVEGDLLTSVALTSPARELPGGLRVGSSTRASLTGGLGQPERTRARGDTTVLSYGLPGVAADRFVEFHVAGDTLRRVAWVPYVD